MIIDGYSHQLPDIDPAETREWVDSLDSVVDQRGRPRARFLLARLMARARELQVGVPAMVSSDYINTIPPEEEPWFPGDEYMERRIRAFIRWNAMAMVTRANRRYDGLGGHLSTYASSASLYETGFNHFFRGKDDGGAGDQVFFQGHAAPGVYSRAYLEGRLTEDQLDHFRREVGGAGLPSYPHPRRMPDFWEFPTVSMGIGPLNAVYQARFNRYLLHRQIADTSKAKVWCFVGDGEMDEPESMAALHLAATEQLDNLIFVVNCNLQRLDGPVRGNGKIIQELEATYRGGGWNVIKVIWGRAWDDLLQRDVDGVLVNQMNTTCDGQFQKYSVESGAYIREHFFGPDPRLRKIPEALRRLQGRRGARGQPDGHPGQDHQGLDARPRVRGPQRHPPDQEDDRGGAEDLPRPALPRHSRQGARRGRPALLPPRPEVGGARVHAGPAAGPRRPDPGAGRAQGVAAGRGRRPVQGPAVGHRREGEGLDHQRLHPAPAEPHQRPDDRQADRADHPRRGADVRP